MTTRTPARKVDPLYRICSADDPAELASEVNQRLSDGWQLYGFPFIHEPQEDVLYCQALVACEERPIVRTAPPVRLPRPSRARVAPTFGNVAAFLAVALGAYLLVEALLFRTSLYSLYLQPFSTTGVFEMVTRFEVERRPSGRKEIMIVGSSRLREGFSARLANEAKPDDGYYFVNGSIPGANVRSWYYFIREVDPKRDRYKAILVPIDDYDDPDTFEDVDDRLMELREVVHRLRLTDIVPFAFSFRTWSARMQAMRGALLKGVVYQRDFQEFLEDPPARLKSAGDWRRSGNDWMYGYGGDPHALTGLTVDWKARKVLAFPPDMQGPEWIEDSAKHLFDTTPQNALNRTDHVRWIGALIDLYRGSQTRIILYQVPRGPAMPPYPRAHLPWTTVDALRDRPQVTIADRHRFEALEQPELFADWVHLNTPGRVKFTPMLAELAREVVR